MGSDAVRVGILGASGYVGAELLRLCAHHPSFDVVFAAADATAGSDLAEIHPQLAAAYPGFAIERVDDVGAARLDVAFLALPPEASLALVPRLFGRIGCVVDLSAAFRLRDGSLYPRWYGFEHDQLELLAAAVYGLPELYRADLKGAELIATPGCYVTAAGLALTPLVRRELIDARGVIVDAASGVSGAGRALTNASLFCTVDGDFRAYGLLDHRHTPEIEQVTGAQVLFTPHLAPMNRGILATCYARPARGRRLTTASLLHDLSAAYADEPFVVVGESPPSTKATLGTNAVHLTARFDERTGYVVVVCALDNLTKGASGGAVQAANVALGLDETAGLTTAGLCP